jgi:preprotein translocase subunit SecA
VIIGAMDKHWQDHLTEMEELRQSVGLRGYGQKDPLNEYKNEAFLYFEQMMKSIRADVCHRLFHSATNIKAFENMLSVLSRQAQTQGPVDPTGAAAPGITGPSNVPRRRLLAGAGGPSEEEAQPSMAPGRNQGPKVGRNDPCPCGSGKKYKKCCGRVA